jgi:hypothetical protein
VNHSAPLGEPVAMVEAVGVMHGASAKKLVPEKMKKWATAKKNWAHSKITTQCTSQF